MKFVVEAIGVKSTGGIELALSLLSCFAGHREHEFVVLLPDLPQYAGLGVNTYSIRRFNPDLGLAQRHFILNRIVPRICRDEGADALLCLGNFAPRRPACPTVVLLQNAWNVYREPAADKRLSLREKLTVAYGRRFYHKLPPDTRVVVQTPVMEKRLVSYHGVARQKVEVIPTAPPVRVTLRHHDLRADAGVRTTFNFLCMSRYAAHKNLEALVDAAAVLRHLSPVPFRCLLTLSPGEHRRARKLLERIRMEGMEDILVNLGPVSRAELPHVYAQADACLQPTLLETVGFTYDEAMQFGLPILTSARDFSWARCGDAAIYFDPLDSASIAATMSSIMVDRELRARLIRNGRKRMGHAPGWPRVAARYVSLLEQAAAGRVPGPIASRSLALRAG